MNLYLFLGGGGGARKKVVQTPAKKDSILNSVLLRFNMEELHNYKKKQALLFQEKLSFVDAYNSVQL